MHILWFRRDLRLSDNEIVSLATANRQPVLPCFIIDPWFYNHPEVGKARVRFLFESLENLDQNLRQLGSQLYLLEGSSIDVLTKLTKYLLQQGQPPKLFFNRDVQVAYGIDRDRAILDLYHQLSLDYHLGLNNFLQIGDRNDAWRDQYYSYQRQPQHPSPTQINTPALDLPQITFAQLKQKYAQFWPPSSKFFVGGENSAMATLASFLKQRFYGYHWRLSRPCLAQQGATSHLSPHFVFGTISVRAVYQATKARVATLADQPKAQFALKAFRDRLRWRDSFTQRLYNQPEIAHTNLYREFDQWYSPAPLNPEQQSKFAAWQAGQTGFPLVDASMRQLQAMGWMNFRMRAMCATFLTVNCGISWHHGAKHYMNCLVDGDLAIDNWQWQMQAGIVNPLSETFRIYNPNKNIGDRDPDLKFLSYWVPELRGYSLAEIQAEAYRNHSPYLTAILNWSQTRKVNGKIISDLRKKVRQRLLSTKGEEYEQAAKAKATVDKYWEIKHQQYQEYRQISIEGLG
ncbi:MAG: deoxyribodipyrimidine photo-lyase [Aphanocapsa sp. GSE-SYN-MK-11-07L]|jgi:deoxyribodipyrimidine photo-lyase|nr:deoxyribodipyrimidine photo-lyase [Aphanocapsa sp. GSE-SYN-MK-11-07L]